MQVIGTGFKENPQHRVQKKILEKYVIEFTCLDCSYHMIHRQMATTVRQKIEVKNEGAGRHLHVAGHGTARLTYNQMN